MPTRTFVRYSPMTGTYLVAVASDKLPAARRFVAAAPLTLSDGGEGGDLTVSVQGASSAVRGALRLTAGLGGTADAPDVRQLRVLDTSTPQVLTLGEVRNGQVLARVGSAVVGMDVVTAPGGALQGNLDMGMNRITNLSDATGPHEAATLGQIGTMLNGLEWQASVIDKVINQPVSPANGDRYLVLAGGDWTANANTIATFKDTWQFQMPSAGWTVHIDSGGHNFNFNGSVWSDIGASIDHNSLLGLTTDDPHTQYQLRSEIDVNGKYAGLDADGFVNKRTKHLRLASPDPEGSTQNPGDIWVNGPDLRYRNNNGGSAQTETVERRAMKGVAGGYAELDGGSKVVQAPASHAGSHAPGSPDALPVDQAPTTGSLRTLGAGGTNACAGNDSRLSDARTPTAHKSSHMTGGDALSPADIGAVPSGRHVDHGVGLSGGGELSMDHTLQIAAFTGLVSYDLNTALAGPDWSNNEVRSVTVDSGADGMLVPARVRLPMVPAGMESRIIFTFNDLTTTVQVWNTEVALNKDLGSDAIADCLMGDLANPNTNNGRCVQRITIQAKNVSGDALTGVTVGIIRLRAYAHPRGAGGSL